MTVLDEIRALDEQKQKLLSKAKAQALATAEKAVAELNELGFNYRLTDSQVVTPTRAPSTRTGQRRSGIRDDVLNAIKQAPEGISRAELIVAFDAKGDKSAEQSISNALSALKKSETITANGGKYMVVA